MRSSGRPATNRASVSLAASSRETGAPPEGKSAALMLELWSRATTIATPRPATRVRPATVRGRARVAAEGGLPVRLAAGPEVAQQVDHRGRRDQVGLPQRQAAQGAHLLLERARDRRLDGQVSRVVRPGRHLVDDQVAEGREEEL